MQDASNEKVEWRALQDQQWAEKQERQDQKTTQVQRIEEMVDRIMEGQENARCVAEEDDAAASTNHPEYAQVLAQFEPENKEQLTLLQRSLTCESVSTLAPTHSDLLSLQSIKRMSSTASCPRTRSIYYFRLYERVQQSTRCRGHAAASKATRGADKHSTRDWQSFPPKDKYNLGGEFGPGWFAAS